MEVMTVDLMEAIRGRRAIRAFTLEQVSAAEVDRLIEAAIQAPSSMGLEPWAFVVIDDAAKLRQYSDLAKKHFAPQGLGEAASARVRGMLSDPNFNIFHGAPTLIVICATNDDPQSAEDCCLAAQNLMLAAYGAGLGTCPIGFSRPWLRLPETKNQLGIPPRYVPVFPVVVGRPAERPASHGRRRPVVIRA